MGDAAKVENVVVANDVDVPDDGSEVDESEREEEDERPERWDSVSSLDPSCRYPYRRGGYPIPIESPSFASCLPWRVSNVTFVPPSLAPSCRTDHSILGSPMLCDRFLTVAGLDCFAVRSRRSARVLREGRGRCDPSPTLDPLASHSVVERPPPVSRKRAFLVDLGAKASSKSGVDVRVAGATGTNWNEGDGMGRLLQVVAKVAAMKRSSWWCTLGVTFG
jgi:hypothetical protein